MDDLLLAATAALASPGMSIVEAERNVPAKPGLYAVSGARRAWTVLGLGEPPDGRPFYIGKAERSLLGRDVHTHFTTGKTGWSTVRRTLAGLLATTLDLHAQPRTPASPGYFDRFGLEPAGDDRLTAWMVEHLRLAVWASPQRTDLGEVETAVLAAMIPPLNLSKVRSPWRAQVTVGRTALAAEARVWMPT